MAQDVESLYAGVKALVCVVKTDRVAQAEMDRRRAYQTLAMLLRRKKNMLNSHILHLIFSLVGTVDSASHTSTIPNVMAFQDLLCDIEVAFITFASKFFFFFRTDQRNFNQFPVVLSPVGFSSKLSELLFTATRGITSMCRAIQFQTGWIFSYSLIYILDYKKFLHFLNNILLTNMSLEIINFE